MAKKKIAPPAKPKPKPGPAPMPAPVQLPPSKLMICQYGFAFLTLKGRPSKLKVTGNSNPSVTPRAAALSGGSVVVIVAGQNFGASVITITGFLWTPTGSVPFAQRVTISVVLCPQKMPPPPPVPPPDPPVVGPNVNLKPICAGESGDYTLKISVNGARVGLVKVTVVSNDTTVATASYDWASQTVKIVGKKCPFNATITVSGEAEGPNFNVPFVQNILVTVICC
jgi:hypothetical protein